MYSNELGINFFGNESNKKRHNNKIEILKNNINNFKIFLVIAGTDTSQIPGISAAGINAKSRRKTALADAEFLLKGEELNVIAKEINGPSWGPTKKRLILMNYKKKLKNKIKMILIMLN